MHMDEVRSRRLIIGRALNGVGLIADCIIDQYGNDGVRSPHELNKLPPSSMISSFDACDSPPRAARRMDSLSLRLEVRWGGRPGVCGIPSSVLAALRLVCRSNA